MVYDGVVMGLEGFRIGAIRIDHNKARSAGDLQASMRSGLELLANQF